MLRWALMCEMLPDQDGKKKLRIHSEVFATKEDAIAKQIEFRRQNLPFSCWPFQFEDPRDVI